MAGYWRWCGIPQALLSVLPTVAASLGPFGGHVWLCDDGVFGCCLQVLGCVDITVMMHATGRTVPCAYVEIAHGRVPVAAVRAQLAGRIPPVRLAQLDTVFGAFRLQMRDEAAQFLFGEGSRQVPVAHHALDVQVFDGDEPWFLAHQLVDGLVHVVVADVGDALPCFLYGEPGLGDVPAFLQGSLVIDLLDFAFVFSFLVVGAHRDAFELAGEGALLAFEFSA